MGVGAQAYREERSKLANQGLKSLLLDIPWLGHYCVAYGQLPATLSQSTCYYQRCVIIHNTEIFSAWWNYNIHNMLPVFIPLNGRNEIPIT